MPGVLLNDRLDLQRNLPVDGRYGPYATTTEALAAIVEATRYKGLSVGIIDETTGSVTEYWFKDGTTDDKLVVKTSGSSTTSSYGPYNTVQLALAAVLSPTRYKGLTVGVIDETTGSVTEYWFKDGTADDKLVVKTSGAAGGDDLIDAEFEVLGTTIGSYAPGSKVLKGEKVEDVIKKILQKRIGAVYTGPTLTASGWPAALMEIGAPVAAFTITPTFTQNDAGALTGTTYKKDGAAATASIAAYTAKASTAFNVDATYGDGPIKKDNMGVDDPAGQIKADTASTSFTQSAIYPYFWGVSTTQPTEASVKAAITAKTANKVIAGSDGNISITFAASSQFLWFATPATSTTKKRWYNTESNQAGIGPGELFNSPLTSKVTSGENYWTDIDYKIYLGSGATSTNGVMQLRNN
jgi:hypothetical protein